MLHYRQSSLNRIIISAFTQQKGIGIFYVSDTFFIT